MHLDIADTRPAKLGESPVWDRRTSTLYSVDIDSSLVRTVRLDTGAAASIPTPGRPGSVMLTDRPGVVLVAAEKALVWLDVATGEHEPWIELETGNDPSRLNDGVTDRSGGLVIGSMDETSGQRSGYLYSVRPDGSSGRFKDAIGVSNGLAFSPDGTTMYFADTRQATVWAYDYDAGTGEIRNERAFLDFEPLPGSPDGATVDEAGCYWVACVRGSAIVRISPDGKLDRTVELPVDKPTKPAFGGPGLSTLFVTSIGGGASHPRYDEPGLNGQLLALDVGVGGIAETPFAG